MSVVVDCKDIHKTYGYNSNQVLALQGISLQVKEKELVMFLGPSGSGKTTLLSIIGGILDADSGDCLILNESWLKKNAQEKTAFRGKNIGFVFQTFNLIPTLTCEENTAIPLFLQGLEEKQALNEARLLLEKLGLKDKARRHPNQLSGGEMQRVAIARGCIHKPKLILCDEPTSYLDQENGKKAIELLKEIQASTSSALIIVTHDVRILDFADKIFKIEDGKIVT
ncbi:MAG: ABC transporter ATP-binding protein [Chlamydiae bacterium]|nr:ABC transporter ATP-binding protein [Chlamydiota bacterium]